MNNTDQTGSPQVCIGQRQHLTALLDGELAPADAAAAQAHLGECAACRAEFQALSAVRDLASPWTLPPGRDLWPAIQAAVETNAPTALMAELRHHRAETQALRAEVAQLRQELAARPPQPPAPRVLFPFSPPSGASAHQIV